MKLDDILKFKDWVIENIEVIVANSCKVKHTPGRKTDKRDSGWLAELCLNGMIEPSRVFPKDYREIMTRIKRLKEDLEITKISEQVSSLLHGVVLHQKSPSHQMYL